MPTHSAIAVVYEHPRVLGSRSRARCLARKSHWTIRVSWDAIPRAGERRTLRDGCDLHSGSGAEHGAPGRRAVAPDGAVRHLGDTHPSRGRRAHALELHARAEDRVLSDLAVALPDEPWLDRSLT